MTKEVKASNDRLCCSKKYPYPSGNSSLALYFPLKPWPLNTPPPGNLQISSLRWVWIFPGAAYYPMKGPSPCLR